MTIFNRNHKGPERIGLSTPGLEARTAECFRRLTELSISLSRCRKPAEKASLCQEIQALTEEMLQLQTDVYSLHINLERHIEFAIELAGEPENQSHCELR